MPSACFLREELRLLSTYRKLLSLQAVDLYSLGEKEVDVDKTQLVFGEFGA